MSAPSMTPLGWLRWAWRQLMSMRTALFLLLLLGVAAIPGSVLPQRSVSAFDVAQYKVNNPTLGKIFESLGLFGVYSAPWFSAIYLLLFISLVGCIIPRWIALVKAFRTPPGRIPTNLARLSGHDVVAVEPQWQRWADGVRAWGYRVRLEEGGLAAERGIVRELGNLIFHTSLLGVLVALAVSSLWGFRGTAIVVEGGAFANTLSQYDEFAGGAQFNPANLERFSVTVDKFEVEFNKDGAGAGAPKFFRSSGELRRDAGSRPVTIEVNHPLDVSGTAVHLLGHGYAPIVTVTDGAGNVAYSGPVIFLPQDGNFASKGVIKAPDARPSRLAFEAFFLPTGTIDQLGPRSVFPDAMRPLLVTNAWSGPPRTETGVPENVHALNKNGLTQLEKAPGVPLAAQLKPGASVDLPGGQGKLTFEGYKRWAKLQLSAQPGLTWTLVMLGLALSAMTVSLFTNARRLYVRRTDDGVEFAGLDRVDGRPGLDADLAHLRSLITDGEKS